MKDPKLSVLLPSSESVETGGDEDDAYEAGAVPYCSAATLVGLV